MHRTWFTSSTRYFICSTWIYIFSNAQSLSRAFQSRVHARNAGNSGRNRPFFLKTDRKKFESAKVEMKSKSIIIFARCDAVRWFFDSRVNCVNRMLSNYFSLRFSLAAKHVWSHRAEYYDEQWWIIICGRTSRRR